ncbi:hypothetical protein BJV74DRAFT_883471 [Russula compacta]|nr:hypothetical protein BJV74DRAFT_883471 [Russula compacta]
MHSVTHVNDDLMCRGRVLRREWKRYEFHLAKSTSLPELELVPAYRPLFTCQQCGFSNVYIPLCLWCKWSSPEAAVAFEAATPPRSRRISGPGRVIWKADPSGSRHKSQGLPALSAKFSTSGALRGSKPLVATNPLLDSAHAAPPDLHSNRDSIVRADVIIHGNLDTGLPHKPCSLRIRRGLRAASIVVPSRYPTMTTATATTTIPSSSPHTVPMSGQARHTTTHPVSLPPIVSPSRTLRRKHHMTFPRQKSTRSLRSWTPAISPPQPVPIVSVARLGHPSRPYYTAIRPHLNDEGTSPSPNTPTTRASTPSTSPDKGQLLPSPPPGRPSFEFTRPRRSTTSGWSLSGEIELQIELSQRREEEEGTVHGSGKRGSILRGVRKLGTGLRDLVLRRG